MKQVIVVDASLNLSRGKLAVQVAHASVIGTLNAKMDDLDNWRNAGMPKIVVRCESQTELRDLLQIAEAAGLPAYLVRDAGKTDVPPSTVTCLCIGPALAADNDHIAGDIRLL